MNKFLCFAFTLLCFANAFGQDRVITKNGDVFEAYRIDVGSNYVYYTKEDKEEAVVQKISKSDVLMIKKKDGTKINVTECEPNASKSQATQTSNGQQSIVQVKYEDLPSEAKAANDAFIAKYNAPFETFMKEKCKKHIGKTKAYEAFAIYGVTRKSVISNEDLEIRFILGHFDHTKKNNIKWVEEKGWLNHGIMVNVRNKTNKTIYVDLGNSFYVSLGQAQCYYVPSSTSTTQGASNGGSVNLGAITGALGIGGVAGTLANGISVGGGSSNSTTNTTYSQRVMAIPPMSSLNLPPQYMYGNEAKTLAKGFSLNSPSYYGLSPCVHFLKESDDGPLFFGDKYEYSEENSPLQLSNILAYSYEENCSSLKSITTNLYLRNLLGKSYRTSLYGALEIVSENILYNLFDISRSKENKGFGTFPKE